MAMANRSIGPSNSSPAYSQRTLAGGGEPPHDGGMEARIAKVEEAVATTRERLATIEERLKHVSTKDQVEGLRSDLIKWFVGTALILASLAFTAAKFIH